jgi:protein CpxP
MSGTPSFPRKAYPRQLDKPLAVYIHRRKERRMAQSRRATMKKSLKGILALTLGSALTMVGSAMAQSGDQQQTPPPQGEGQHEGMRGPGGPEGRRGPNPEERLKRLTETLSLTTDQQSQIKGFMQAEKTKMDALRDDTSVEGEAKREKAMQIRKDTQTSIRGVLTADQQTKFDKMQAEMKTRGERRGPPPPPPQSN